MGNMTKLPILHIKATAITNFGLTLSNTHPDTTDPTVSPTQTKLPSNPIFVYPIPKSHLIADTAAGIAP